MIVIRFAMFPRLSSSKTIGQFTTEKQQLLSSQGKKARLTANLTFLFCASNFEYDHRTQDSPQYLFDSPPAGMQRPGTGADRLQSRHHWAKSFPQRRPGADLCERMVTK
jgi:hypothetical protein